MDKPLNELPGDSWPVRLAEALSIEEHLYFQYKTEDLLNMIEDSVLISKEEAATIKRVSDVTCASDLLGIALTNKIKSW